ncbi:glycosyltransferase family 2 protein [Micromonospora zhanjiangensis]|uniref:Glycosyltransferase family 2 protein n=1 Tax=Micromonospora zhanjiangensis TaxID=1522057 RepID=A0ABV8KTY5_9ACTN
MTLLSVIIPVYRVEEFLPRCLESVLGQSFTDVEVIAVDDASDDGCADILARYARWDPRLHVVTLPANAGLGAARNAGIARATGDYVWCVDSDDWLPDGTLAAVATRLRETTPDVLVTGYARVYPDSRVKHYTVGDVTRGAVVPGVFTFAQQPGLLDVLWIACNKVFRREFLNRHGFVFGPGWYEDVAFVLPALLAAERISLLDRYCYAYRQRPAGAITFTVSRRHFEVFDQWRRVFEFLDAHPGTPTVLRSRIFQKMIWHVLQVLGHDSRVPRADRHDYFRQVCDLYRRYRPLAGVAVPGGNDGVKQRLVAVGAYWPYEALNTGWQTRGRMLRTLRSPGRRVPTGGARPTAGAVR